MAMAMFVVMVAIMVMLKLSLWLWLYMIVVMLLVKVFSAGSGSVIVDGMVWQKKRGTLPVHALRYVNSTKVIYRLAFGRKGVFRDVRIKANLDLM